MNSLEIVIALSLVAAPQAPSFEGDVLPILTKTGCNAATCHGAAAGRGGFALSLYGGQPAGDYDAIVRQFEGRRVNLAAPAKSLLLRKPLGELDHGGDVRLEDGGPHAKLIQEWIAAGAPRGTSPKLMRLQVEPADTFVEKVPATIDLSPVAVFMSGEAGEKENVTRRDVRDLAVYIAADETAAKITDSGRVTLLRRGRHLVLVRFMTEVVAVSITAPLADKPVDLAKAPRANFIDDEILATLVQLRLEPSPQCNDATFLRRARLDLTGRLPTPEEVEAFLKDVAADKRERLIDALLASEDFLDYWTFRFAELLRIRAAGGEESAAALRDWVRTSLKDRTPLDKMAVALVTGDGDTQKYGPANFYRAAGDARGQAEYFSEVLLGVRLRCANCHNHPLDRWTQDDYHGLAAVFAKLDRGSVVRFTGRGEVSHPATGEAALPRLPGERFLPADGDHRRELAEWLVAKQNPYFARAMVNRLWAALMGRGLVEPVDDFRASNPPSHPRLLEQLAADFAAHDYDLRHTLRLIATSAAYARASGATAANRADDRFYSRALKKPLSAEVLLDAIGDVTGVPEKFHGQQAGSRAIGLLGPHVPSAALDVLGRCSRTASCESSGGMGSAGLSRQLHLINGELLNDRIASPAGRLAKMLDAGASGDAIVREFYLRALSRLPDEGERRHWQGELHASDPSGRRQRLEDFVWGLLNCDEFVNNH